MEVQGQRIGAPSNAVAACRPRPDQPNPNVMECAPFRLPIWSLPAGSTAASPPPARCNVSTPSIYREGDADLAQQSGSSCCGSMDVLIEDGHHHGRLWWSKLLPRPD